MQVWGTQPNRSPNGLHLGGGTNVTAEVQHLVNPSHSFKKPCPIGGQSPADPFLSLPAMRRVKVVPRGEASEGQVSGARHCWGAGKTGWLCRKEVLQSAGRGEPPEVKIQKGCAQWDTGEFNASLWVQGIPTEPARRDSTIPPRVLTIKGLHGLGTGQGRGFKCQHDIPM